MKSIAELAIVALMGTVAIMAGIIIPPYVIKTTIDKETLLAYKFEQTQHSLLSFLSSTQDGKSVYELFGTKVIVESTDITKAKNNFDKVISTNYCILIDPKLVGVEKDIVSDKTCQVEAVFNTVMVVPYNKDSLVKVIGIGVK